jgi:hypothetical protein
MTAIGENFRSDELKSDETQRSSNQYEYADEVDGYGDLQSAKCCLQ